MSKDEDIIIRKSHHAILKKLQKIPFEAWSNKILIIYGKTVHYKIELIKNFNFSSSED